MAALFVASAGLLGQDGQPTAPKVEVVSVVRSGPRLDLRIESQEIPDQAIVRFQLFRKACRATYRDPVLRPGWTGVLVTGAGTMRRGRCDVRLSAPLPGPFKLKVILAVEGQPAAVLGEFKKDRTYRLFESDLEFSAGTPADSLEAAGASMSKLDGWIRELKEIVRIADSVEFEASEKYSRAARLVREMATFESSCGLPATLEILETLADSLGNTLATTAQPGKTDKLAPGKKPGGYPADVKELERSGRDVVLKAAEETLDKIYRVAAREAAGDLMDDIAGHLAQDAQFLSRVAEIHKSWRNESGDFFEAYTRLIEKEKGIASFLSDARQALEGEPNPRELGRLSSRARAIAAELREKP